ncbi:MAG TPA: RHS repeat domain-containing protein, partial [Thermoanaerobaculia bacterium]
MRTEIAGLATMNLSYEDGLLATLAHGGRATTFTYNALRELATVTDSLGRQTTYTYDAGRVTEQTLPDGRAISFSYDNAGNLTSVTPPGRPEHALSYTSASL